MGDIAERVTTLVAEHLAVNRSKVLLDTAFVRDLKADPFSILELVVALEEEFEIEIPRSGFEQIATVGDAIIYVGERLRIPLPDSPQAND